MSICRKTQNRPRSAKNAFHRTHHLLDYVLDGDSELRDIEAALLASS
ncbi:MAG: hypothetical protein R3E08_11220 [Thiotrichaceae bacterium]